ncbi:uncharacterized protein LOC144142385 isoform X2 [Haemaphysalis longicornis]
MCGSPFHLVRVRRRAGRPPSRLRPCWRPAAAPRPSPQSWLLAGGYSSAVKCRPRFLPSAWGPSVLLLLGSSAVQHARRAMMVLQVPSRTAPRWMPLSRCAVEIPLFEAVGTAQWMLWRNSTARPMALPTTEPRAPLKTRLRRGELEMQNANVDAEQQMPDFEKGKPLQNASVEPRIPHCEKEKPLEDASVEQRIPHCEKGKPLKDASVEQRIPHCEKEKPLWHANVAKRIWMPLVNATAPRKRPCARRSAPADVSSASSWTGASDTAASAPVFEAGESSSHISLPPDAAAALSAQAQALLAQQRQFFNDREATQLERSLQAFQPCLQRNSQTAHSAVTEKAGPHVCLVCNKHFLWKGNLQTHMRQHTGEKPFACRFCPECYTRKYSLQQHERTHTGVKPYTCTVCHKSFSRKASLIKHDTTHSGERPFACSVCDKRFAHKSDQARHVRVHTGERPYVCKVCDKKFSQRSSLAAHEKTHGTHKHYTCNVCDKQFFYRWSFAMHERMHSGERPHVCGFCQRSFAYKNALVKHEQRLHAVIKPFECTTCETGLLAREQFVAHMKLHALQKPKNLEVVLASGAWGTDE